MKLQARHILLVDNASAHKATIVNIEAVPGFKMMRPTHIMVVFLPANTTSVVQPLGAGVIAAFIDTFQANDDEVVVASVRRRTRWTCLRNET